MRTRHAAIADAWRERRSDIERDAGAITEQLRRTAEPSREPLTSSLLTDAVRGLRQQFDPEWGGFGPAPKFPPAMTLGSAIAGTAGTKAATEITVPWTALTATGSTPAVWIVDPVDGTNNFAAGKTPFAVMVADVAQQVVGAGVAVRGQQWCRLELHDPRRDVRGGVAQQTDVVRIDAQVLDTLSGIAASSACWRSARLRSVKSSTNARPLSPSSLNIAAPISTGTRLPSFRKYSFSKG